MKQRDELGQTGVYLMLGPRDDGEGEKLYIGEGDPIRRLPIARYAKVGASFVQIVATASRQLAGRP